MGLAGIEMWHDILTITWSMFFTLRYNIVHFTINGHNLHFLPLTYSHFVVYLAPINSFCIAVLACLFKIPCQHSLLDIWICSPKKSGQWCHVMTFWCRHHDNACLQMQSAIRIILYTAKYPQAVTRPFTSHFSVQYHLLNSEFRTQYHTASQALNKAAWKQPCTFGKAVCTCPVEWLIDMLRAVQYWIFISIIFLCVILNSLLMLIIRLRHIIYCIIYKYNSKTTSIICITVTAWMVEYSFTIYIYIDCGPQKAYNCIVLPLLYIRYN